MSTSGVFPEMCHLHPSIAGYTKQTPSASFSPCFSLIRNHFNVQSIKFGSAKALDSRCSKMYLAPAFEYAIANISEPTCILLFTCFFLLWLSVGLGRPTVQDQIPMATTLRRCAQVQDVPYVWRRSLFFFPREVLERLALLVRGLFQCPCLCAIETAALQESAARKDTWQSFS